ncbi:RadC family protein [Lysobacter niastensis]
MSKVDKGRCGALLGVEGARSMATRPSIECPLYVRGRRSQYRPATAEQIVAAARQVADLRMQRGASFKNPSVACDYFRDKLTGLEREVFAAVFLDTQHRLIECVELFQGTIDGAEVHPRELVRQALMLSAAAVIVAHNHPSGDVEPSAADRAVTIRLKQALALVDVRLLDHIIVGGSKTLAMAELGWA